MNDVDELMKRYQKLSQEYEILINYIDNLLLVKTQMEEDIEMLELSLMYKDNKNDRWNNNAQL